MIRRLLVANRGEIAVRIVRACRDLGIESVQVHSDADRDSLAVRLAHRAVGIGPAPARESYLNAPALIAAARFTDCDAIHPGYGFLSESANFAELCARSNLVFVGPSPAHIRLMGDKAAARSAAQKAGVPVIPGSDGALSDPARLTEVARDVGYPLLIKASAGGGGKGMRVVESPRQLEQAFVAARSEADAAFSDPRVYIERYLPDVRHIEVQVLGDAGHAIHLGERDCTVQRRHQKLVEETPSPALDAAQRHHLTEAALRLARAVDYVNAGTMEFVFDNTTGEFFFIEMNTRLQVEHPVTEMATGVDLVVQQLRIASRDGLGLQQSDIRSQGHALECRINAEDTERDFLPQPGTITGLHLPTGPWVRVDTHAFAGCTVSPYYDSLVAKIIVHGPTRDQTLARMARALGELRIDGITTNLDLQRAIMADRRFMKARINTRFLEELPGALRSDALTRNTLPAKLSGTVIA
jgi:acetyl-CoA carboxylase, biotin carboxylase subunit